VAAVRVLFTCLPLLGHFHPLVPLARALENAGHEVAFATGPTLCPLVVTTGFRAFPMGFDPQGRGWFDLARLSHAAQHLALAAAATFGAGSAAATTWREAQCHTLKHTGAAPVLTACTPCP